MAQSQLSCGIGPSSANDLEAQSLIVLVELAPCLQLWLAHSLHASQDNPEFPSK